MRLRRRSLHVSRCRQLTFATAILRDLSRGNTNNTAGIVRPRVARGACPGWLPGCQPLEREERGMQDTNTNKPLAGRVAVVTGAASWWRWAPPGPRSTSRGAARAPSRR